MYLDVVDIKNGKESKHRIFGDSVATFFYQCAVAGKHVINLNYHEYVLHESRGSYGSARGGRKRWDWFNKGLKNDPMMFKFPN